MINASNKGICVWRKKQQPWFYLLSNCRQELKVV